MTAQIIYQPRAIAAHEDRINRDEWAAVGTDGDYAAQMERQRREAVARREAEEMAAWRVLPWFCVAFTLGLALAGAV